MKTYCIKQKKQTECVEPSGYKTAKNGKLMYYCKCAECDIMKSKFVKSNVGRGSAAFSGGLFDEAILETAGRLGRFGLSQAIKSKMAKELQLKWLIILQKKFIKLI